MTTAVCLVDDNFPVVVVIALSKDVVDAKRLSVRRFIDSGSSLNQGEWRIVGRKNSTLNEAGYGTDESDENAGNLLKHEHTGI